MKSILRMFYWLRLLNEMSIRILFPVGQTTHKTLYRVVVYTKCPELSFLLSAQHPLNVPLVDWSVK
jgi:hypothetical protein